MAKDNRKNIRMNNRHIKYYNDNNNNVYYCKQCNGEMVWIRDNSSSNNGEQLICPTCTYEKLDEILFDKNKKRLRKLNE